VLLGRKSRSQHHHFHPPRHYTNTNIFACISSYLSANIMSDGRCCKAYAVRPRSARTTPRVNTSKAKQVVIPTYSISDVTLTLPYLSPRLPKLPPITQHVATPWKPKDGRLAVWAEFNPGPRSNSAAAAHQAIFPDAYLYV
jgi:hypothetical protein